MFTWLGTAHAALYTNTYQVEIIVFQNQTPEANHSPRWQDVTTSSAATTSTPAYPLLASNTFVLNKEANSLAKQKNYRILAHLAWHQTFDFDHPSQPMAITASDPTGNWSLSGHLKIKHSNFFYVTTTLTLRENFSDLFHRNNEKMLVVHDQRKIRDGQLNYIDNPVLGVLIKITPDKQSEKPRVVSWAITPQV